MRNWLNSIYTGWLVGLGEYQIPIIGEMGEQLVASALDAGMIVGIHLYIYWINRQMDDD